MMRINWRRLRWSLSVALIALLAVASVAVAQGTIPTNRFSRVVTRYLTVSDDATITDNLTVDGVILSAASVITLTNGGTLTIADSFHPIASAGTIGASLSCPAGLISVIENTVNQTITFTDTGTVRLTANFAMGQYDTLTVIGDGTSCLEVARANN
jgi:hypothetical protein